jgi:endonuclease-3 related protein
MAEETLSLIYQRLLAHFGQQRWWPAETAFEVIVGAILTQRTNWRNAAKAIERLKEQDFMEPKRLAEAEPTEVADLIKVSGFYSEKAQRLIETSKQILAYDGLERLLARTTDDLRKLLLGWRGIGPETSDAILLYAADRLSFPVDAYTLRMVARLGFKERQYAEVKALFEASIPKDLDAYKEFHALIDALGKTYCKAKPKCVGCPLRDLCKIE